MPEGERRLLEVAVGGLGAVGLAVAQRLDRGIPGLHLAAVSAANKERAARIVAGFSAPVPIVELRDLAKAADVVVECAPAELLPVIAEPALRAGKTLIVISVGALLSQPGLIDLAAAHGGRIIVPSGALLGLDAVTAAAEGTIHSVRMITNKPVQGLVGAPYLVEHGIELDGLSEPLKLFEGNAREAAQGFPANLNVAAALALAGVGPDRTRVEIWADPAIDRNIHQIEVKSDSADFAMRIENIPSDENPRTGRVTALSVIAALRRLTAPLRIGT